MKTDITGQLSAALRLRTIMLLSGMLFFVSPVYSKITREVIDRYPGKVIIYYQDGTEVARETIDKDGNLTATGKIPSEYYTSKESSRASGRENRPVTRASRKPSARAGGMAITVNQGTEPYPFSLKEFAQFRIDKVKEFQDTGIYPLDYDPFSPPHNTIYGPITPGVDWTDFSFFYICNPYLLITLCKPTHVIAFAEQCDLSEIRYEPGVIEEVYEGDQAARFFEFLQREPELSNAVRLWMVNAQDAGFPYIAIDKDKCENIDFDWHNTPDNIANCVYSLQALYHVGSYKKNNISPDCSRAILKVKEPNQYTCIYVKLWSAKPASKNAEEDFAYIIKVIPLGLS